MGSITLNRTGRSGHDGGVFVSRCGDIYNILCLGACPNLQPIEDGCIRSGALLGTGGRSRYHGLNSSACLLDIITITHTACEALRVIFTPGVGHIAVDVVCHIRLAAYVTVVIVVGRYVGTGLAILNFTAAVITDVIFVG